MASKGKSKKAAASLNYLREWREFRHMTQEQLAVEAKTTKAVISLLESGDRGLSDKWLRRLAGPLRARPGWILDHDPNDLPTNVFDAWAAIPEEMQSQALRVLETFSKKVS